MEKKQTENSKRKKQSFLQYFNREIKLNNCLKKSYFNDNQSSLTKKHVLNPNQISKEPILYENQIYIILKTEEILPLITIPSSLIEQVNSYIMSDENVVIEGHIVETNLKGGSEKMTKDIIEYNKNQSENSSFQVEYGYISDNNLDEKGRDLYEKYNFSLSTKNLNGLMKNLILIPNKSNEKDRIKSFLDESIEDFYNNDLALYRGKLIKNTNLNMNIIQNEINGYLDVTDSIYKDNNTKIDDNINESNIYNSSINQYKKPLNPFYLKSEKEKEIDFCDLESYSNMNIQNIQSFKMENNKVKSIRNTDSTIKKDFEINMTPSESLIKNLNLIMKKVFIFHNTLHLVVIYPNISFEIQKGNKFSIVSSDLSLYLTGKNKNYERRMKKKIFSGLISLDQQLRFVLLPYENNSRQEQIQGIWISLFDYCIYHGYANSNCNSNCSIASNSTNNNNKRLSDKDLFEIISNNKLLIIERLTNFLLRKDLEEVNSSSPNKNSFFLIVFISQKPYFFDVSTPHSEENEYQNQWIALLENRKLYVKDLYKEVYKRINDNDESLFYDDNQYENNENIIDDSSVFSNLKGINMPRNIQNKCNKEKDNSNRQFKDMPIPKPNQKGMVIKNLNSQFQLSSNTLLLSSKDKNKFFEKDNKSIISMSSNSNSNGNRVSNRMSSSQLPVVNPNINIIDILFDQAKTIKDLKDEVENLKDKLNKVILNSNKLNDNTNMTSSLSSNPNYKMKEDDKSKCFSQSQSNNQSRSQNQSHSHNSVNYNFNHTSSSNNEYKTTATTAVFQKPEQRQNTVFESHIKKTENRSKQIMLNSKKDDYFQNDFSIRIPKICDESKDEYDVGDSLMDDTIY